jgi:serine/threonine-protein kinase RsbW
MRRVHVLDLPNDLRAIERSIEQLLKAGREVGFDDDRLRLNLRVGVTEALANAMLYGNRRDASKRVRLEATITRRKITVCVTDEGPGFDPARVLDPTLPRNRDRAGGRGLFLIRKLMDEVEFNERGNSIRMVLRGSAGDGADGGARPPEAQRSP